MMDLLLAIVLLLFQFIASYQIQVGCANKASRHQYPTRACQAIALELIDQRIDESAADTNIVILRANNTTLP